MARLASEGRTIYGEWLYAKHTVFYDALPHYFLEFDVRDADGAFWSTARRREWFAGSPVQSVPVLWEGVVDRPERLPRLVARALYKSAAWRESLASAIEPGLDRERVARETDSSDLAEGLYIKVEQGGCVVERYKWVRASFLTSVTDSGSHWLLLALADARGRRCAEPGTGAGLVEQSRMPCHCTTELDAPTGCGVSIRVILWDVSRSSIQQSTQQRSVPSLSCARFPAASLSVPQVKVALSRLALEPKPTTN